MRVTLTHVVVSALTAFLREILIGTIQAKQKILELVQLGTVVLRTEFPCTTYVVHRSSLLGSPVASLTPLFFVLPF